MVYMSGNLGLPQQVTLLRSLEKEPTPSCLPQAVFYHRNTAGTSTVAGCSLEPG